MREPFSAAYASGSARAAAFFAPTFRDRDARIRTTRAAAARTLSPSMIEAIRDMDAALPPSDARFANIEHLANGAAVVVTGQQIGLFGGPLYTIYKAATAISTARALSAEAGVPCVPIFWLQTEDHDLVEIDHAVVPRPGGAPLRLRLSSAPTSRGDGPEARVSVGLRRLPAEITALHDALADALAPLPHAADHLALLRDCYAPGRTLALAFARLIAEIFSRHGLILLDPRDVRIASLRAPIVYKAIRDHAALGTALVERTRALEAAGFEEQVHARPDALLCFLHQGGDLTAPRFRPLGVEGGFRSPDGIPGQAPLSEAQLLATLEGHPLAFSTSALLRPIVQDSVLPTAAYVAGPGEINYFAQLGPLYDAFGVAPPLLVPRARFRLIDARTRSLLEQLGLSTGDMARPRVELLSQIVARETEGAGWPPPAEIRAALLGRFERELGEVEARAEEIDPSLNRAVARTRVSVARAVDRLVGRYERSLVARGHVQSDRLDRALSFLQPDASPQERVFSLPYFASRYGVKHIDARVFAALDATGPFAGGPVIDVDLD